MIKRTPSPAISGLTVISGILLLTFFMGLESSAATKWALDTETSDRNINIQVEKELTDTPSASDSDKPKQSSTKNKKTDSSTEAEKVSDASRSGLDTPTPEEVVTHQAYCFSMEGTGLLDCFQLENSLCTEEGSQLLISARGTGSNADRFGDPFCSTAAQPVAVAAPPVAEGEEAPPPMPVVTQRDFQSLLVVGSTIRTDSNGFGLRGAHTNFYAESAPQTLTAEMLGQQVSIQAVPAAWTWNYGDGSPARTVNRPGEPQGEFNEETATSHIYTETGIYPVNLTTTYRGQYSVNGGPWLPIMGAAQVPSSPVTADIWRTKTKNVAEDCISNPTGWGCQGPEGNTR